MNRFTDPKAPARELVSFGKRHERCIMSDKTPPDEDVTTERKAALIAGSIVALAAVGLVAWGILEFILRQ
jgi:hypothetical protein